MLKQKTTLVERICNKRYCFNSFLLNLLVVINSSKKINIPKRFEKLWQKNCTFLKSIETNSNDIEANAVMRSRFCLHEIETTRSEQMQLYLGS